MNKTEMTKTWCSPKTEVRKSQKEGDGFFAIKDLKKDEVVAIKSGYIVQTEEAARLDREVGDFSLQISDDFYICPSSKEDIDKFVIFINHSCNPNIGMDGEITYVAMRDIKAGEELCLDYAMAITGAYKLECKCGSEFCRQTITGDDWKNKKLQKKYAHYFSWFIFKKFGI